MGKQRDTGMFTKMYNTQIYSIVLTIFVFTLLILTGLFQYLKHIEIAQMERYTDALMSEIENNQQLLKEFRWAVLFDEELKEDLDLYFSSIENYSQRRLDAYLEKKHRFKYHGVESTLNRLFFDDNRANDIYIYKYQPNFVIRYGKDKKIQYRSLMKNIDNLEKLARIIIDEFSNDESKYYIIQLDVRDYVSNEAKYNLISKHYYQDYSNSVSKIEIVDTSIVDEEMINKADIYKSTAQPNLKIVGNIQWGAFFLKSSPYFLVVIFLSIIVSILSLKHVKQGFIKQKRRMNKIILGMQRVIQNDYNTVIKKDLDWEEDELEIIRRNFNHMVDSINQHIERVYKLQVHQSEMEFKILQSQINPHFLYNTLEVIRMKAIIDGNKNIADMIYSLSSVFRLSLSSKFVHTLEEEVLFIDNYIKVYQMRYPNKINYIREIDRTVEGYYILKFILQPLVENCLLHAFDYYQENNILELKIKDLGKSVFFSVKDNGVGITRKENKNPKSLGIKNIKKRLRYQYQVDLTIISKKDKGTLIFFNIPKNKLKGDGLKHV